MKPRIMNVSRWPRINALAPLWVPKVQTWACADCGYQYNVEQAYARARHSHGRLNVCDRCPRCGQSDMPTRIG